MPGLAPSTYVPILYTKRGERSALNDLSSAIDSAFVPLLVINGVEWDYDNDEPKRTIDDHLHRSVDDLLKKWRGTTCFVDAKEVDDDLMADGRHPLTWIVEAFKAEGRTAIPVIGLDRSASYQYAVQGLVASHAELCVRLTSEEWIHATTESSSLFSLIALMGGNPHMTHLVFDAGSYGGATTGSFMELTLGKLCVPEDWKSVIVAASSMPSSMPPGDDLHTIPRREWSDYVRLSALSLPRTPSFGDYGVQSPEASTGMDPRLMSPSNNLRYLMDDHWLLPKAGQFRKGGSQPLVAMLALLTEHPDYVPGASACEVWIDNLVSTSATSAGNPEVWRRYGTVRHITRSVELLASLYGPSGSPEPGHAVP